MGQTATLRSMDSDILDAFEGAGMSDTGTYTPPATELVPEPESVAVRVMLDRSDQFAGEFAPTVGRRDVVTLLLAEVASPVKGGVVVVDGFTLKLESELDRDVSAVRWSCGRA